MKLKLPEDEISRAQFLEARELAQRIEAKGFPTFIVGGAVRDCLLGIPSPDVDICTACPADILERIIPEAIPWGPKRYSIYRVTRNLGNIEIARFREETECDGRHCEVRLTNSFDRDVIRRDFTINALAVSPESMEIIDLVGGVADLSSKVIRTIGDPLRRYNEDKLRMLRAVRFSTRLIFSLSPDDFQAISHLSPQIRMLSPDRIRHEIDGILSSKRPGTGLQMLAKLGLWQIILCNTIEENNNPLWPQRFSSMDRAASINLELPSIWAIALAPLDLDDFNLSNIIFKRITIFNFSNSYKSIIEGILNCLKMAHFFETLSKADSVALADSKYLATVREIHRIIAPDSDFETQLARRFPRLYSIPFLSGPILGEYLSKYNSHNIPFIITELRYAELSGHVSSREEAILFLENLIL